jgi:hypothetical protein
MTRSWWRSGGARVLSRRGAVLAVAGIAAYASYQHMRSVALHYGEGQDTAALLPLSVDALIVITADALLHTEQIGKRATRWARAGFLLGVGASLAANIAAAEPVVGARIISAWAPVALLITVEYLGAKSAHERRSRDSSQVGAVAPLGALTSAAPPALLPPAPPLVEAQAQERSPAPPRVSVGAATGQERASATEWRSLRHVTAPLQADDEEAPLPAPTPILARGDVERRLRDAFDHERSCERWPDGPRLQALAGCGSKSYARKVAKLWREQEERSSSAQRRSLAAAGTTR